MILTESLAILEILKDNNITANMSAGLSLGEYTALINSKALMFEYGIKIVQKRGEYMQNLLPSGEWQMAAIMGLKDSEVEEVCKKVKSGFVDTANYNSVGQVVISGEKEAISEAEKIAKEKGFTFVEDAGRGYRRVVASPQPVKIVELDTVKQLADSGTIVITVGGGGIPVIDKGEGILQGVDAVIDKDKSSAKLAKDLDAEMLVILTAVDRVCVNFNKPNQEELDSINLEQATKYISEGHFAKGSMLPKVEACVDFVESTTNGKALITS